MLQNKYNFKEAILGLAGLLGPVVKPVVLAEKPFQRPLGSAY